MSYHSYWKKESSSKKSFLICWSTPSTLTGAGDSPRELRVSSQRVTKILDESMKEILTGKILPKVEWTPVLIGVQDSGPGLNPKDLDCLFDAFYTTRPQGLGMGLAISRSIIEAHRGQLWAKANIPPRRRLHIMLPIGEATRS
jgi:signal transduction histidine kinase